MPMNNTIRRNTRAPLAPIAANAPSPTYFPTITESTVLYSCWAKFPIRRGMENSISLFDGLPSVMSFAPPSFLNKLSLIPMSASVTIFLIRLFILRISRISLKVKSTSLLLIITVLVNHRKIRLTNSAFVRGEVIRTSPLTKAACIQTGCHICAM